MVHDALWRAAGNVRGYLCIGCLERRLGRQLVAADFTDAVVNRLEHWHAPRLAAALARGAAEPDALGWP